MPATDTGGLVVITQLPPISVVFTLPEQNLQLIRNQHPIGDVQNHLPVLSVGRDNTGKLGDGVLEVIDNLIDQSTGTLKLKASFPNIDNALFPNQFVNVQLLVDLKKDVTLVPVAAIQHGNQGTFVYIVDTQNNTVSMRDVTVGTTAFDGSNAEIQSGISPGEVVVTDGVDKLQNGSKIIITPNGPAAEGQPAGRPAGQTGSHAGHRRGATASPTPRAAS